MPPGNQACVPQILSLRSRAQAPNRRSCCNEKPGRHNYREPTRGNGDPVQPEISVNRHRESDEGGREEWASKKVKNIDREHRTAQFLRRRAHISSGRPELKTAGP